MIPYYRKLGYYFTLIILSSCNVSDNSKTVILENEIIDINITEAIKDVREFKLSEIVKDVEFISLESTVESYFRYSSRTQITDHYILIVGEAENKLLLFDRSGKFLRQIGRSGRGPSEFTNLKTAAIDPKERFIIVSDGEKFIKFNLDGTFNKQQKRPSGFRYGREAQPLFLDNEHFAFALRRPNAPTDDFYKIAVYDSELKLVEKMIHTPNNDSLCLKRMNTILSAGSGMNFFFEGFIDTLYSIEFGQEPKAKYHFTIDEDAFTLEDMTGPYSITDGREYHSVSFVADLPKHLLITTEHNSKDKANVYQVIYDKTKKEAYSLINNYTCYTPSHNYDECTYSINNDLFGLSLYWIGRFSEKTCSSSTISLDISSSKTYLKCLRELNVLMPEKLNELADMIEGYTGEENPLLVLLHYK